MSQRKKEKKLMDSEREKKRGMRDSKYAEQQFSSVHCVL